MGHYSVLKINELSSHEKTRRTLKCILLSERNESERAIYRMIPTVWHFGKGKTMEIIKRDNKKISGCQGWRYGVAMTRQSAEDSKSVKTLCIIMTGACHYKFVQTCGMFNTKSENLWQIMDSGLFWCVCVCPFLVTSMSFCWLMLVMGQAMHVCEEET